MPPATTQVTVAKEIIANLKVIGVAAIAFVLLFITVRNTSIDSDVADLLIWF
jgi:hypothetical protein